MNVVVRLVLPVCLMFSSICGYTAGEPLGVVYPNLRDPYSKVFDTIIDGIENATGARLDKYSLATAFDPKVLEQDISENRNRVIFALGVRGRNAMREIGLDIPVVVGAVLSESGGFDRKEITGISLTPDPTNLFEKLLVLAPQIKIVSVVFNPANNRTLIEDAQASAQRSGLILDARPAPDIHAAALIYKNLAETVEGRVNAIWLLPDRSTIDSDAILAVLLEQAWNRQFIVFSSKLDHAKRGALFSMYPDNFQMGRDLGNLARQVQDNPVKTEFFRLKSLKTAVNMRTAKHLGIDLLSRGDDSFDLVFPMQ